MVVMMLAIVVVIRGVRAVRVGDDGERCSASNYPDGGVAAAVAVIG